MNTQTDEDLRWLADGAEPADMAAVARVRAELERLQEIETRYQQLGGALTAAWPAISGMLATTWTAIEHAMSAPSPRGNPVQHGS